MLLCIGKQLLCLLQEVAHFNGGRSNFCLCVQLQSLGTAWHERHLMIHPSLFLSTVSDGGVRGCLSHTCTLNRQQLLPLSSLSLFSWLMCNWECLFNGEINLKLFIGMWVWSGRDTLPQSGAEQHLHIQLPRTASTRTPGKILYFIQARSNRGHYELVNPIDCENQVLACRMLAKRILLKLGTLAHTKSYGLPNWASCIDSSLLLEV